MSMQYALSKYVCFIAWNMKKIMSYSKPSKVCLEIDVFTYFFCTIIFFV